MLFIYESSFSNKSGEITAKGKRSFPSSALPFFYWETSFASGKWQHLPEYNIKYWQLLWRLQTKFEMTIQLYSHDGNLAVGVTSHIKTNRFQWISKNRKPDFAMGRKDLAWSKTGVLKKKKKEKRHVNKI